MHLKTMLGKIIILERFYYIRNGKQLWICEKEAMTNKKSKDN